MSPNNYFAETSVARSYNEWIYNSKQLEEYTLSFLNSMLPEDKQLDTLSENEEIKFTNFKQINVHTDTGWPTYGYSIE